uniref:Uncharacterized protein n=1 Tax=Panagrolaimus davidi TaxID=227884 RepID=A0A914PNJ4_9BILA
MATATLPSNNFAIRNFQPHIAYPPPSANVIDARSVVIPSTGSQNQNSPGSTDNDLSDNGSNSHTTAETELSPTRAETFGNHFSNNQNFPPAGQHGNNSEFFSPFGSNSNFLSYPMGLSTVPQMNFVS